MIKMVQFLVRADDLSHDEFVERWRGEHADVAADLPGLRKYVTSVPTAPERADYDGVVEMYFDDFTTFAGAFDSEPGQRVQEDAAEFVAVEESPQMIVEETVHLDET